jgi:hypothetical protein
VLATGSRMWLAGNPGPPPSLATIVFIPVAFVLALVVIVIIAQPRRRREEPLREELAAQPAVTFRAPVRVLGGAGGLPVAQRGSFYLVVRGDVFEVANPFRPARLFGQQYCYRAPDTTVKVMAGFRHHWIEIEGQPPGTAALIWIRQPGLTRQLWYALTSAGAHPIGPAPPP